MSLSIPEEAFKFVSSEIDGPETAVRDITTNASHRLHFALEEALGSVDQETIEQTKQTLLFRELARRQTDYEARMWALVEYLNQEVSRRRCTALRKQYASHRPSPYDNPAVWDLSLDTEFLVPLKDFEIEQNVLLRNGAAFAIVAPAQASNSSYWFSLALAEPAIRQYTRVRLDPLLMRAADEFPRALYKWLWYGGALQWDLLDALSDEKHIRWGPDSPLSREVEFTDAAWTPRGGEVHLTYEELPKRETPDVRGSRYLHAIYHPAEGHFSHVDAAIRLYSLDDFDRRLSGHVGYETQRKAGTRVKVFRVDGAVP